MDSDCLRRRQNACSINSLASLRYALVKRDCYQKGLSVQARSVVETALGTAVAAVAAAAAAAVPLPALESRLVAVGRG